MSGVRSSLSCRSVGFVNRRWRSVGSDGHFRFIVRYPSLRPTRGLVDPRSARHPQDLTLRGRRRLEDTGTDNVQDPKLVLDDVQSSRGITFTLLTRPFTGLSLISVLKKTSHPPESLARSGCRTLDGGILIPPPNVSRRMFPTPRPDCTGPHRDRLLTLRQRHALGVGGADEDPPSV